MGYKNKCYICLKVYISLAFIFGWLPYLLYIFNIENPVLYKSNWDIDMISDIIIIDSDQNCPNSYESLLQTYWPGIKQGCKQQDRLCDNYLDQGECPQNCTKIDSVGPSYLTTFTFDQQISQNDGQINSFKICGKRLKGVNLYSWNTSMRFLCQSNQKQCQEEGRFYCINKEKQCAIEQIECRAHELLCDARDRVICIPNFMTCRDSFALCLSSQKTCQIKEYTVCIDKMEQCPITDIEIQHKMNTVDHLKEFEKISIKQNSNYNLFIRRNNPEGYPVVEFKIAGVNGVCLNYDEASVFYAYILDKREVCQDEERDEHFVELISNKLKAVQLYEINHIQVGEHKNFIPSYDEYKVFYRKYLNYKNNCQFNLKNFDSLAENLDYLKSILIYCPIFTTSTLIFQLLIIHFNNKRKHPQFIYIYSILLFLSFFVMFYLTFNLRIIMEFDIYQTLDYYKMKNCFDDFTNFLINRFYEQTKFTAILYEWAFLIYLFPGLVGLPIALSLLFYLIKHYKK